MSEDIQLPDNLPFTATQVPGHTIQACDHCGAQAQECFLYILRFPDDVDFIEWEMGVKDKRKGKHYPSATYPLKQYFTHPQGYPGHYCCDQCALKSYFPAYVLWRLRGNK